MRITYMSQVVGVSADISLVSMVDEHDLFHCNFFFFDSITGKLSSHPYAVSVRLPQSYTRPYPIV